MSNPASRHDVVVVGSGFGGSITALRLAEAARSVLVLERGRRYVPGQFPRDVTDVDRVFWRHPRPASATGLFDLRVFSGIGVVVAAGVGGGSLIYANVNIRPDPELFEDPRWPAAIDRGSLDPYYDKVAEALDVRPLPTSISIRKRDLFHDAAHRVGHAVFDPDQAVMWEQPTGAAGEAAVGRHACQLVAECEFGCQHGAKNSADLTYLARAERLGAEVRTGTLVSHIVAEDGGYTVAFRDVATGTPGRAHGKRVVLAAGTLGTNEILLRSRDDTRTLPALSPTLGHGFSGNGDFLGSVQHSAVAIDPARGPDVTSVIRYWDEAPEFTMAAPTFNAAVMDVLASLGQPRLGPVRLLAPLLWPHLDGLVVWALRHGLLRRRGRGSADFGHMTNLFAIGRDNANGRVHLRPGRPMSLDIEWDYARENEALIARMVAAMEQIALAYGGRFSPLVTWDMFRRILSVHPLGGCRFSPSISEGVVSPDGEVHGYPALFVADGSVVPTAIGFHPAMTIAALAERTSEAIVATFPN